MRTSVDIPDGLLRRARALAHRRGTTLRALMIAGLKSVVEDSDRVPYRVEDRSFGEGGLVPGLDAGDWDAILDRAYGTRRG